MDLDGGWWLFSLVYSIYLYDNKVIDEQYITTMLLKHTGELMGSQFNSLNLLILPVYAHNKNAVSFDYILMWQKILNSYDSYRMSLVWECLKGHCHIWKMI